MNAPRRVVLDTDVLRFAATRPAFRERLVKDFPLWALSAVVAHELRRAARSRELQAYLDLLSSKVPTRVEVGWSDWMVAADYLRFLGSAKGFDATAIPRHQNDCLVAASAWRLGMPVVTCNGLDFERISRFLGPRAGPVVVLSAPPGPRP
ncbi:MAG: type II toxin-antitoxin system VapC family toxin [Myxococcaceae bacterium]